MIVPEAAPDVHPPVILITFAASLFPPPEIKTGYPSPLVVSIPTGQGVRVTVAGVPPVNELEIVCVQFSAVVA